MNATQREYHRNYYKKNKAKRREYFRNYYQKNKNKINESDDILNDEKMTKQKPKRSQAKIDAYNRFYRAHKEERKEYYREYYRKHKEERKEYYKEYYARKKAEKRGINVN